MITVTKAFLPPLEEYHARLRGVWECGWITNEGPLVTELEEALRQYLGVKHLLFVSNGTLALQLAIKALDIRGDVLTTPFSYVATTSSIVWEQCRPVFVDVDPRSLCLNPDLLEAAITPATQAIVATHVFGTPCAVEQIEQVAQRHGLRVIYDAAHAFGVQYHGTSLLRHGDVSTLSFHATKLFHTGEGGAIVTDNDELARKLAYMRNFGHEGAHTFAGLGINAKNSEIHAALGLCVLPHVPELMRRRRALVQLYDQLLAPAKLQCPQLPPATTPTYSYYPVLFRSEAELLRVCDALQQAGIYPRRYFYPVLTTLPYAPSADCPVATDVASRVLCLPLYYELAEADVARIAQIIQLTMA
ncbi:DegT/DnrJ/EryC1/StrS family aminotransferase [Hymenobacter weizhouensis]|uniref:DegT/DnrJ/EryC1/StrS family aminotransferase n=1 Tax=Hymenobacter sp. YIM 151500-1 TaxID=2987689 RepID=UPI0022267B74|nr:DegT/DnrJ/EryC1/StrS family aminotransferase [Hymenobacter sp. YIM 151500-1]UYZ65117.1 DegT/DnrJ/EryC1/StrS family aminotransferase [Hymenobacter sp. YIM 151500-1]